MPPSSSRSLSAEAAALLLSLASWSFLLFLGSVTGLPPSSRVSLKAALSATA